MGIAEAMRLAASNGCDCYWDSSSARWIVAAVSYDSDACSLSAATLAEISPDQFLRLYIPDRP